MPRSGKGGRYHHGDLRAALIDTAVELIGERGVREFSLAEASRRLGVAVSAPYAHFADRDDLLAAVAVRAFEIFTGALLPEMDKFADPAERLAGTARGYAMLLLDDGPDPDPEAVELAAERTARAVLALIEGRRLLG